MFNQNDAPILLVFGQSNAAGHATLLAPEEQILQPLTKVFGLPRTDNQRFSPAPVVWSGYVSGENNLAETTPEHVCLATEFARLWQSAAERDPSLPALRVIPISIGAQGVTEKYMWYPDAPIRLHPGPIGVADISLYQFSLDVISRTFADLRAQGLTPRVLGLHWLGGEQETGVPVEKLDVLPDIYKRMFAGWREAAGCELPILLYRLCSRKCSVASGEDPASFDRINEVFEELARTERGVSVFDARTCPNYDPSEPLDGLFGPDAVHYKPSSHRWFAACAAREAGIL